MANSVDPDRTAPIGAVCSGPMVFASILNSSEMLGNYLQQTTFSDAFFLGALRFKNLSTSILCVCKAGGFCSLEPSLITSAIVCKFHLLAHMARCNNEKIRK